MRKPWSAERQRIGSKWLRGGEEKGVRIPFFGCPKMGYPKSHGVEKQVLHEFFRQFWGICTPERFLAPQIWAVLCKSGPPWTNLRGFASFPEIDSNLRHVPAFLVCEVSLYSRKIIKIILIVASFASPSHVALSWFMVYPKIEDPPNYRHLLSGELT